jgi:hypothetical protein
MNKKYPIELIKQQLVTACVTNDPKSFRPYLLSPNVQTEMPSKAKFYNFFKGVMQAARDQTEGKLSARTTSEEYIADRKQYSLGFFDEKHVHERLSFIITETSDIIIIELMPF